jgi:hypothetical protein
MTVIMLIDKSSREMCVVWSDNTKLDLQFSQLRNGSLWMAVSLKMTIPSRRYRCAMKPHNINMIYVPQQRSQCFIFCKIHSAVVVFFLSILAGLRSALIPILKNKCNYSSFIVSVEIWLVQLVHKCSSDNGDNFI